MTTTNPKSLFNTVPFLLIFHHIAATIADTSRLHVGGWKNKSLLAASLSLMASGLQAQDAEQLGWVDDNNAGVCRGYYSTPALKNSAQENGSGEKGQTPPIVLQADRAGIETDGALMLHGDVTVSDGTRELKADSIRFIEKDQQLELHGQVSVQEANLLLQGEDAVFNQGNGTAELSEAQYLIPSTGARGSSSQINRDQDQQILLHNGSYTSCPPRDNSWKLSSSEISLDPVAGYGKAYNALLRIKDIPVFYFPYMEFPIDERRKSGFLWPSISSGSSGGIDLATPYYLNLAPNYDMTLSPRYISGHGLMTEVESRYLNTLGEWIAGGAYLDDDYHYDDRSSADPEDSQDNKRWLASLSQSGEFSQYWRTELHYARVSDRNYFKDLGTIGLDIRRDVLLTQSAIIDFQKQDWAFRAELQDFQTLDAIIEEQYALLPRLSLIHQPLDQAFQLQPTLLTQYSFFDHKQKARGQRLYLEPGLKYPMQWQAGYLNLHTKFKHLSYQLSEELSTPSQTTSAWQGGLAGGLTFERNSILGLWRQTFEPEFSYLYTQDQEQSRQPLFDSAELPFNYQQLFRDSRFTGYDRISDADQLSLSLSSHWWSRNSGRQIARFSIGRQFYFQDRRVTINDASMLADIDTRIPEQYTRRSSPLTGVVELKPSNEQSLYSDWVYNDHRNEVDQLTLQWQLHDESWNVLNLGYRFSRNDIDPALIALNSQTGNKLDLSTQDPRLNQAEVSGLYQVHNNVSLMGRWRYDINDHKSLEHLVGIEYDSCCWQLRLVYQREAESFNDNDIEVINASTLAKHYPLQYDDAIFLQIELKGLGNIAGRVNNLLEESISGFRQREAQRR